MEWFLSIKSKKRINLHLFLICERSVKRRTVQVWPSATAKTSLQSQACVHVVCSISFCSMAWKLLPTRFFFLSLAYSDFLLVTFFKKYTSPCHWFIKKKKSGKFWIAWILPELCYFQCMKVRYFQWMKSSALPFQKLHSLGKRKL